MWLWFVPFSMSWNMYAPVVNTGTVRWIIKHKWQCCLKWFHSFGHKIYMHFCDDWYSVSSDEILSVMSTSTILRVITYTCPCCCKDWYPYPGHKIYALVVLIGYMILVMVYVYLLNIVNIFCVWTLYMFLFIFEN